MAEKSPLRSAAVGGRRTSDGGVLLLAQAQRRLGIADWLIGSPSASLIRAIRGG